MRSSRLLFLITDFPGSLSMRYTLRSSARNSLVSGTAVSARPADTASRNPSRQQCHHHVDALTALHAAATGGVDSAWLGGAGGRCGLFHLAVGQRVAEADIHGGQSSLRRELVRLPIGSFLPFPVDATYSQPSLPDYCP